MHALSVASQSGLITLLQATVLGLLLVAARVDLRREWRAMPAHLRWLLPALGLLAALLSAFFLPGLDRYVAVGHEANYADCFFGRRSPSASGDWENWLTYPGLRWAYWGIGALTGRMQIEFAQLLSFAARAVAVSGIGACAWLLCRRSEAAICASVLLALHGGHAFWGSGLYNVALPMAFAVSCLLLALLAWRSGASWTMAAAAATGAWVPLLRIEWGVLAPALGLLLLSLGVRWGRHPAWRGPRPWLPTAAVLLFYGVWLLGGAGNSADHGGVEGLADYLQIFRHQALLIQFLEPLDGPWAAAAAILGLAWWTRSGGGGLASGFALLGMIALPWLLLTCFNDFSGRHALLPSIGLVLAIAMVGPILRDGPRPWAIGAGSLLLACGVASGVLLLDLRGRYYGTPDDFEARLERSGAPLDPATVEGGCYLITDNERLWSLGEAGSHFNLMDEDEARRHWDEHGGCILWLLDHGQERADGLAVRARARKLRAWFRWERRGWVRLEDGHVAEVYAMVSAPWSSP